mmetsp:Transcript_1153/g.1827  ORF Transcript_1153/g.1827 Transcript_1153/m.1827 type:complete len:654 (-) Transcript_1153:926-2887(-)
MFGFLRHVGVRRLGVFGVRSFSAAVSDAGSKFRNVAIVAHVDHGKTTLVDALLESSGACQLNDRAMDSNDLEKERGITILSKVTSLKHGDTLVNLVDTPGHSDFSGEVERVLSMVDGICLVVDATDGPMPQTKYVLSKALQLDLKPIVVINKIDRPTARTDDVEIEVFDLFCSLDAKDHQLEYDVVYACGKAGWASRTNVPLDKVGDMEPNMLPLLDAIESEIPAPHVEHVAGEFRMLISILESDATVHLGKILQTGLIVSGEVRTGDKVKVIHPDGSPESDATVIKMFKRVGMQRYEIEHAVAGDIITLAGVSGASVADTICSENAVHHGALDAPSLDPPTLSMWFSPNTSPFVGHPKHSGGTKLTAHAIKARLLQEAETNVAIQVSDDYKSLDGREAIEVHGRGEMQLGILIENMRREGFELGVSPPLPLFKHGEGNDVLEPVEEVQIDVEEQYAGGVIETVAARKGEMIDSVLNDDGTRNKLTFHIPSRGMIGLRSVLTELCRGDAIVNAIYLEYQKYKGAFAEVRKGVLVASHDGVATTYALGPLESRGELFISPTQQVYTGMVVGEHSKSNDLPVNVAKTKKLTNVRAAGKDDTVRLSPPRQMQLEDYIGYIQQDELVEVTPNDIRIRKSILDGSARRRPKSQKPIVQ